MNGEIFFNFHPSVAGGFVAWNHSEAEGDKHLIVVEGGTFAELGQAARAAVELTWEGKAGKAPLLICFRQMVQAPEGAILASGSGAKDLLQWLARRATNPADVRNGAGGYVAFQGLGPHKGMLVAPTEAAKPESTFLIAHAVRDWSWNVQDPAGAEAYATWLRAKA